MHTIGPASNSQSRCSFGVVIIIRSSTDRPSICVSSHPDSPCTSQSPRLFQHVRLPSVCPRMSLWLRPVTCALVLVLVPIVPVCLLGVPCVCDSVPPASFSLRLSYCSALASLCTDPRCWCVRSGRCLALRAAFWCSIRQGIPAQQPLGSSFRIHVTPPGGAKVPSSTEQNTRTMCKRNHIKNRLQKINTLY